ncbi:hypothetical protein [Streptomyces sp. NPDC001661]
MTSSLPAGLTLCHDLTPTAWVRAALPDFAAGMVGSLLPAGYERYVRVLHPADRDEDGPGEGTLPGPLAAPLAETLGRCTTTPLDCYFGVWEGCGYLEEDRSSVDVTGAPRLELPHRGYAVFQGALTAVTALSLALVGELGEAADVDDALVPDLWWPADRSWFVHGDTDLTATWIACSAATAERLLSHPGLEAVPMDPASPVLP